MQPAPYVPAHLRTSDTQASPLPLQLRNRDYPAAASRQPPAYTNSAYTNSGYTVVLSPRNKRPRRLKLYFLFPGS